MNLSHIRSRFPVLERVTYFNHCGIAPLSLDVVSAVNEGLMSQVDGSGGSPIWRARVGSLKGKIARLINAQPDEIAFMRNTVEGLATVAGGILWRDGDIVVTDNIEFPGNIYPWWNLESRYGVKTKLVPARDGRVLAEDLIAACDARTRAITVSFVQFSNGYRTDMDLLGEFCRQRGIYFCIDAIQGLGPLQLDVLKCRADFLACGGHKWLLGPIGMGFLYVRKELQQSLWPVECGHLSVLQNTEKYTEYNFTFRPSAEKFEGGVANYAGVFGLDAALSLFHEVGLAPIEARVLEVTDYLCEELTRRGYRLRSYRSPSEKSGTVSFVSDRHPSKFLFERLTAAKIIVTLREDAVRVAPHFFNTHEEIDRLLAALPAH